MKKITLVSIAFVFIFSLNVFSQKKIKLSKELKDFVFIPAGEVFTDTTYSTVKDTTVYTFVNFKNPYSINSFYISSGEITNIQYREFLDSLKNDNELEKLKIAQIDDNQWDHFFALRYQQPMVTTYSKHPAYNNYPVVNISYDAALLYCEWLTNKYNRINKNKNITYNFSLPTKLQFIRAARGNAKTEYSWESPHLMEKCYFCNFRNYNAENVHYNSETKKYEIVNTFMSEASDNDLTAPVFSYWPNKFGVYNMCGNVAEMILEKGVAMGGSFKDSGYDVRVVSTQKYNNPAPYLGFRPVLIVTVKE